MTPAFNFYSVYNNLSLDCIKDDNANFFILKLLFFINTYKKKFRNKFTFEGDEKFSDLLQKQLLSSVWEFGCAAITRKGDAKDGIYVVHACIPRKVNNQGEITEAVGVLTASLSNFEYRKKLNRDSFNVRLTNKNSVFLVFNSEFYSGLMETYPAAINYAEAFTAFKNQVIMTPSRFSSTRTNTENVNNVLEQSLKDFDLVVRTKVAQTTQKYGMNTMNEIADPKDNLLPLNLNIMETKSSGVLGELMDAINDIKTDHNEMTGERTNINFKPERNITSEFSFSNVHFSLLENDFNTSLIHFVEKYEETFGIELDVIDVVKSLIEQDVNLNQTGDDLTDEIVNSENGTNEGEGDGSN